MVFGKGKCWWLSDGKKGCDEVFEGLLRCEMRRRRMGKRGSEG